MREIPVPVIEKALAATEGMPNGERARMIAIYLQVANDIGPQPAPRLMDPPVRPAPQFIEPPARIYAPPPTPPPSPRIDNWIGEEDPAVTQAVPLSVAAAPAPDVRLRTFIDQEIVIPAEPPASIRRAGSTDAPVRTVDSIFNYLQQAAPPTLRVKMPDGGILTARCRILRNDEAGLVKMCYFPDGSGDFSDALFTVYADDLDAGNALADIAEAIRGRFSAEKRTVTAKQAEVFSPKNAITVEAREGGENAAALAMSIASNRSPEELAFIHGKTR